MARFLFATWPFAGHVNPCMAVAQRLERRGHEIGFYTGAGGLETARRAGYACFGFDKLASYLSGIAGLEPLDQRSLYEGLNRKYTTVGARGPIDRLRRVQSLLVEVNARSIPAQVEDLRKIQQEWSPDAIIADAMLWGPILVLHERSHAPVVPFSFYAGCLIPGRQLAPAGLGFPPSNNLLVSLRNRAASHIFRRATATARDAVNLARASEGLPPLAAGVHEYSSRLPLYLVASTPEFDYSRDDLPSTVVYAGPCLWEPPREDSLEEELKADASSTIVYVSEGTAQVGAPFLIQAVLEGLKTSPYRVVATVGRQRSIASIDAVPSNAKVLQWVSHRGLFPRTGVVVTTGGSSTVRQALECGVPVLAVPLEWDQLENAQRLVETGAGQRLSRSLCNPSSVSRAVRTLLEDPRYRIQATRIGESFRRYSKSESTLERLESAVLATPAMRLRAAATNSGDVS